MRGVLLALISAAVLGACQDPVTDDQRASEDVAAIAAVKNIQQVDPPLLALTPEPMSARDLKIAGFTGPGCAFRAGEGGGDPIVLTNQKVGVVKLMGGIVPFASDPGSPKLTGGTWSHYVGKAHSLLVEPANEQTGARFTLRDPQERVVFTTTGQLQCSS